MLVLGLLLVLAAVALGAGAIYDGGEDASFELFGQTIGTTISGVFLAGAFTMLIFFLGLWLLFASSKRARRRRVERKQARARQRASVTRMEEERAQLRAENDRLAQELAARDAGATDASGTSGTTGSTAATGPTDSAADATGGAHRREADASERPQHVEGDRVVDHTTDLSTPGKPTATGRP